MSNWNVFIALMFFPLLSGAQSEHLRESKREQLMERTRYERYIGSPKGSSESITSEGGRFFTEDDGQTNRRLFSDDTKTDRAGRYYQQQKGWKQFIDRLERDSEESGSRPSTRDLPPDYDPEEAPEVRQDRSQNEENSESVTVPTWLMYLSLGVVLVIIGFFVARAIMNRKKDPRVAFAQEDIESDPATVPMDALQRALKEAMDAGDFRAAVRIYFVHIMKKLREKGLVEWHRNKTNSIYLTELNGTPYYKGFRETAGIYERVWYGERFPNRGEFDTMQPHFTQFIDQLKK